MKSAKIQPEAELFALRLRDVRTKRGSTQQALAEVAGMSLTYVNNLEHGLKVPSLTTILRLAVALNCKVMELVGAYDKTDITRVLTKEVRRSRHAAPSHLGASRLPSLHPAQPKRERLAP